MNKRAFLTAILCVPLLVGCSGQDGSARQSVTGAVTYAGEPIPGGRIRFSPDVEAGNAGPATVADIVDGRFATRPDKGAISGPHTATIYGEDGTTATETHDNSLFAPYNIQVEISSGAELSIDVPRQEP